MPELNDRELLGEFARTESEAAFAALVTRYVNLVHSTALRFTGNPHHAEEITQAVFIILARKAGKLSSSVVLSGWLYQAARLTAANFVKGEIRRHHREQEAYMQTILNEPDTMTWKQIAPLLDEAMGGLGETDRNAVVLHFFENKTAAEVAVALKLTEAAAHKRTARALEKLRKFFTKRGVSSTTANIAGAISTHSVQAAPVALAKSVTAVAVVKGSIAAVSTLTLVKGTMKMMTWLKLKLATGVSTAVLLAGGVVTVAISQTDDVGKLTAQEIAKQSQDAYAALSSYSDTGTVTTSNGGGQVMMTTFSIRLQRPDLYQLDWSSTGGFYNSKGAAWSDGDGNFFQMGAAGQNAKPEKQRDMQQTLASAMGVSGSAASIPATFFSQPFGDVLGVPAMGRFQLKRTSDEKIGDTVCHVISSTLPSVKLPKNKGNSGISTTTLWIGKRDHLIHQIQTMVEGASITPPPESDADLRVILERQDKPATSENIAALRVELEKSMNSALRGNFVFIQKHEHISVNQKFSPADFQEAQ